MFAYRRILSEASKAVSFAFKPPIITPPNSHIRKMSAESPTKKLKLDGPLIGTHR
jgi:hypothetical protein